jgi:hypothetical protein
MTRADRQTFQTSDSQPQKTQSETVSFGRFAGDASNADSATVGECRRGVRNSRLSVRSEFARTTNQVRMGRADRNCAQ